MKQSEFESSEKATVLSVRKLKKTYHGTDEVLHVLQGVDLQVQKGETVSITGVSGCGKSTLLHLLGQLDSADSGTILYEGNPAPTGDEALSRFRNKTLGFVFQFHYLLEDLTAAENAAMPAFVGGVSKGVAIDKARDLLDRLGLSRRTNHYPNQLSGGEQQRVAIARALINDPLIVLADEPTGNLDPHHSDQIIRMILQLNQSLQQTFIIVSHHPGLASMMQRSYILQDGLLTGKTGQS